MSLRPAKRSRKALAPKTASPVTTPTYSLTGVPSRAVVVLTIISILLLSFAALRLVSRVPPYPRGRACNRKELEGGLHHAPVESQPLRSPYIPRGSRHHS